MHAKLIATRSSRRDFQKNIHNCVVNRTFGTSLWRNAVLMVDDGAIGSESLEQHRLDVAENLTKMAEKHHTIKPKKMRILPEDWWGQIRGARVSPRRAQGV